MLADFATAGHGRIADLGTGSGVVALLLARRCGARILGVELQPRLCALARRNVRLNQLEARIDILQADLRALPGSLPAGTFEGVVANPPFFEAAAGNISPNPEKALARHELSTSLSDLVSCARHLLKEGGTLSVIFPVPRLTALLQVFAEERLAVRRLRFVHPKPEGPARLVLVEAKRNGREPLAVEPPFFLFDECGSPSAASDALTRGRRGYTREKVQ